MPTFTVQTPDGRKIKVEAADQATAIRGAQEFVQANPPPAQQPAGETGSAVPFLDPLNAAANSFVGALPIVGPSLANAGNTVDAAFNNALAPVFGFEHETPEDRAQVNERLGAAHPVASAVGGVAGAVAPFMALPALGPVAGGATMAGISAVDAAARGGSPQDIATSGAIGGVAGAAAPFIAGGVSKATQAAVDRVAPFVRGFGDIDRAAQAVASKAAARDVASGQPVMTQADEAVAAINGQPVLNADRFGPNVRTLARTAKNANPTAAGMLEQATQDRFLTQNQRAVDFVKRITGGATDDLALQDRIANAARLSNGKAYGAAYSAPAAQDVWGPEIQQLFQSPAFRSAVRDATGTGGDIAAISGQKAVKNPFLFDAKGNVRIRKGANGAPTPRSLQFWDLVQRNLRSKASTAYRSGDNETGSRISQMRKQLLDALDSAVPEFAEARAGAAAAFGAEDALEAGRKFVTQRMAIPEAQRAHAKFTTPDKKAFAVGFASSLIDKINAAPDRVNVINQVFGSPASRAQVELALGKPAAQQLEAFTRVEDIMQATKHIVQGGSTTTQQLIASGIIGGGAGVGTGLVTGDWGTAAMVGTMLTAGRMGSRMLSQNIDQKVMAKVAEMLASNDPKAIDRVIANAMLSPQHSAAIKAIETGMRGLLHSGAFAAQRSLVAQ